MSFYFYVPKMWIPKFPLGLGDVLKFSPDWTAAERRQHRRDRPAATSCSLWDRGLQSIRRSVFLGLLLFEVNARGSESLKARSHGALRLNHRQKVVELKTTYSRFIDVAGEIGTASDVVKSFELLKTLACVQPHLAHVVKTCNTCETRDNPCSGSD